MASIKTQLRILTQVRPERMKLAGPKLRDGSGLSRIDDSTPLQALVMLPPPSSTKWSMIGTLDKDLIPPREAFPDIMFDEGLDTGGDGGPSPADYEAQLQKVSSSMELNLISPPRDGKKLLVLDIDYTIFDTKVIRGPARDSYHTSMRPYTHEMLAAVYRDYDIMFWSQTNWNWVEMKLTEMGILQDSRYSVMACMDIRSMIEVDGIDRKSGQKKRHQVKALSLVWRRLPQYGPHNTLHVDDLARNFALNPANGIKIKAYREDMYDDDHELRLLTRYLLHVSLVPDVQQLGLAADNTQWRKDAKAAGGEEGAGGAAAVQEP